MMKMTLLNARETACPDKKYWYTPSLFPYSGTIYSINSSDRHWGARNGYIGSKDAG